MDGLSRPVHEKIMTIESDFLVSLISKAESRLAYQAALVATFPDGSDSEQAVSACELLQLLSLKVLALHRKRDQERANSNNGDAAAKS